MPSVNSGLLVDKKQGVTLVCMQKEEKATKVTFYNTLSA